MIPATIQTALSDRVQEVRDLVALLTPIPDIALLLGVDERSLRDEIDDISSPVSLAYREAKARVALEMRKREIELAEAGSPTASQNIAAYFRQMVSEE